MNATSGTNTKSAVRGTAARHTAEGALTFLGGLALCLSMDNLSTPVLVMATVGLVLMCVGGTQLASELLRSTVSTEPTRDGS
ncbi:DUF5708 family protein [Streptomyces sp. NPDC005438]|uniref:DUF5708 family protein n=1 Tax=Streptomyces sp. NPDC005438 TaxID=3156880 RepID=UPI0033BDA7E2